MILVVGALALLSVFAAIYLAIGASDERTAAAIKSIQDTDQFVNAVGAHAANTIAADRLDVYVQRELTTNLLYTTLAREAFDYPYTDYTVRSRDANPNNDSDDYLLFNPSGQHTAEFTGGTPELDNRVPYDPWLAASRPSFLGANRNFWGATGRRDRRYLDNRDWAQISNFAPDGRFVNLFNLIPLETDNFRGGFDAESGIGTYTDVEGRDRRRMTYDLSLLDLYRPGSAGSELVAFDPTTTNTAWVPGVDVPVTLPGINGVDLLNVPAVWTMNQRYLFFPANQPFFIYDRLGNIADWSSPDYPAFQYADADGDGMYDSRWIEFVDAQNPDAILNLLGFDPADVRIFAAYRVEDLSGRININTATDQLDAPTADAPPGITPADVDLRRILTLSDIALDLGISLAEIDHPKDQSDPIGIYREYQYFSFNTDLSTPPPSNNLFPGDSLDFTIADIGAVLWGTDGSDGQLAMLTPAEQIGALAYDALRLGIDRKQALDDRFVGPGDPVAGGIVYMNPGEERLELTAASRFGLEWDSTAATPKWIAASDPAERRRLYYEQTGRLNPFDATKRGGVVDANDAFGTGLFGADDLGELLTYNGINDPDSTTRLEEIMIGRTLLDPTLLPKPPADTTTVRADTTRLSPLLSNRPLAIDRFGHGDGRLRGISTKWSYPAVSGRIDKESMTLLTVSPRPLLTTISGAAAVRGGRDITLDANTNQPASLGSAEAAASYTTLGNDAGAAFRLFADALAGDSGILDNTGTKAAWHDDLRELDPVSAEFNRFDTDTMHFGHAGPETALRLSAHMGLNVKDLLDEDSDFTAATLIVDNGYRQDLDDQRVNKPSKIEQAAFPWWHADSNGERLDLTAERLMGNNNGSTTTMTDPLRMAVNVFGVEPHPIISEVTVINVYTDASENIGNPDNKGDDDSSPLPGGGSIPIGVSPLWVTIDTSFPDPAIGMSNNHDYMLQVLVFQLHNPYAVPISLGRVGGGEGDPLLEPVAGPDPDIDHFEYYIEYAGRFFKLGKFVLSQRDQANPGAYMLTPAKERYQNTVLTPGQTRNFYVLANYNTNANAGTLDFSVLDQRWWEVMFAYSEQPTNFAPGSPGWDGNPLTGPVEEWVRQTLTINPNVMGASVTPGRLKEFNPIDGQLEMAGVATPVTAGLRDLTAEIQPADVIVGAPGTSDARISSTTVRLWKKMEVGDEYTAGGPLAGKGSSFADNIVANDLLVDRLAVGGQLEWIGANQTLGDSVSWPESVDDDGSSEVGLPPKEIRRNDNKGLTPVIWRSVRRRWSEPDDGRLAAFIPTARSLAPNSGSGSDLNPILAPNPSALVSAPSTIYAARVFDEADDFVKKSGGKGGRLDAIGSFTDLVKASQSKVKALNEPEIHLSFRSLFNTVKPPSGPGPSAFTSGAVVRSLISPVDDKNNFGAGQVNSKYNIAGAVVTDNAKGFTLDHTNGYTAANELRPEFFDFADMGDFRDAMRPADLLNLMPAGWVHAPARTAGGTLIDRTNAAQNFDPDEEWITHAEMLATLLGYDDAAADDPASTTPATDRIDDPYALIWLQQPSGSWDSMLDDARLALDRFVAFIDTDADGVFTPIAAGGTEYKAGTGVPMALDVLGGIRGVDPFVPASLGTTTPPAIERLVLGKININTAPVDVLRMLPGLSPPLEIVDPDGDTDGDGLADLGGSREAYWAARGSSLTDPNTTYDKVFGIDTKAGMPNVNIASTPTVSDFTDTPDVAGSLVAYRDRKLAEHRLFSDPLMVDAANWPFPADSQDAFELSMTYEPVYTSAAELAALAVTNWQGDSGRSVTTGIDWRPNPGNPEFLGALRETPGFRTVGEVLAVTLRDHDDPGTADPDENELALFNNHKHNTMTALAYNDLNLGVDTGSATVESMLYNNRNSGDSISDDYDERLTLANGILNCVDVRSDVYAVWFVIHAYRPSDVENMRPGDPLVPSFARRFVMVLDRSNVTGPEDSPKVLSFKELPM